MRKADDKVDGWDESFNEGLWRYDHPFGVPRWMIYVHLVLAVPMLLHSFDWFWVMFGLQALAMVLTRIEPEWPQIINDWFDEPGELEP